MFINNVFKSCCTPDRFLLTDAKSVSAKPDTNSDLCKNNPGSSLLRTWDVFLFAYFSYDSNSCSMHKIALHRNQAAFANISFLQYNP